jgi:hypothetical protein
MDQWGAGNVKAAARELERLGSETGQRGDGFTRRMAIANLGLGRIRSSRATCERIGTPGIRAECLLVVAYVCGDGGLARRQLLELRSGGVTAVAPDLMLAIFFGETDLARSWAGTDRGLNELISIADGHPQAAKPPWNAATGPTWLTLWHRTALAEVLEQQGHIQEELTILSTETKPASLNFMDTWTWPQCRMKLADLLRKTGHLEDAAKVEDEIRHFLAAADPDYPVLARLANSSSRK